MEPFDWANAEKASRFRGDALTGGPVELEQFPAFAAEPWSALLAGRTLKELEFRRIDDAPYYLARYTARRAPSPTRAASGCISRIRSRVARSRSTCSSTRAR